MEQVSLDSLAAPQLASLKKQLDEELSHIFGSLTQLNSAKSKLTECCDCVRRSTSDDGGGNIILAPLTTSLYVKAQLRDSSKVLVDIGTGFLVEKEPDAAVELYQRKIRTLQNNIKTVESTANTKAENLRIVEEILRQKLAKEAL